ncbi:carboxyl transferase domain-containing protein [Streptomyces minutiscleroticus]|uniref:Acetyl-coenzyme A carboxylase carboxyl transferase subunits beta/alpha n=1 Tax=Streptomyces minutiscleroticus TaxID=68238 RepID=A0A918N9T6_9ACTN|nr:carboxyl transferase domain-containing protein [Streptomyces minutiscleroticus]GGX51873.1 acetyl-CoA carboxylase [Streptomyces minutiscleroticus]
MAEPAGAGGPGTDSAGTGSAAGGPGTGGAGPAARRYTAREAVALLARADDFTELPRPDGTYPPDGPLSWRGYDEARARAAARTGEEESVLCGTGTVGGTAAVLVSFEFGFLGGSLGERTGDRLAAAYAHALGHRLPLVSLVATGGSRMQEGMRALVQLQRVARASALVRAAGLPQVAVLRDPTTGGGWATLGAGADVVLALPGAQVGFAGSRVRPPDADPAAYTAEAQLAAGAVDAVVPCEDLPDALALWLRLLTGGSAGAGPEGREDGGGAVPPPPALGRAGPPATGWEAVLLARSPERPRAEAYLDAFFARRAALGGDRCGGTDDGMLCGFGVCAQDGRTVAYAAQRGTAVRPAGHRAAARLVRLAGRLGVPVLTLVDTPGAANDAEAERQGAGAAIADLFAAVATARTPVTTLLIGEGGSGGALALAAPDNTWATPDSYFSVIAPELAAAILKRSPDRVRATADELRIRPQDLVDLGVVRGIVPPA